MIDEVLKNKRCDEVEVHVERVREGVTRFANSEIHQNVEEDNLEVRVIAVKGRRVGVVTGSKLSDLEALMRRAEDVAAVAPEVPDFAGLAGPSVGTWKGPYDERVLGYDAAERAAKVKEAIDLADRAGLTASGFLSLTEHWLTIQNSNGVRCQGQSARVNFLFLPYGPDSSGYAEATGYHGLEIPALAAEAVERAVRSRGPVEVPPGKYKVVLDTCAVADLFSFVAWLGFSALAHQEQRSFLSGRMGQKVFSELINVKDDPLSAENPGYTFDYEGEPRRTLALVERGVLKNLCYDRRTAHREKRVSTGHGLPPPNPWGPVPMNLVVEPGHQTLEDLIAGVDRGIFVTRLHYTNVVDPRKGIVTGMTRDGTFLIEDGKLSRGIKNLRFTQGLEEAFASVSGVSSRAQLSGEWFKVYAPAMRLETFTFTSGTLF